MKIYERDSKGNIFKFENENERFWYKFWRSKFTWILVGLLAGIALIALINATDGAYGRGADRKAQEDMKRFYDEGKITKEVYERFLNQ